LLQLKMQAPPTQSSQSPQSPSSSKQSPPSQSAHSPGQASLSSSQMPEMALHTWQPKQQSSPLLQSEMQIVLLKQRRQGPQSTSLVQPQVAFSEQTPSQQTVLSGHVPVGSSEPLATSVQLNSPKGFAAHSWQGAQLSVGSASVAQVPSVRQNIRPQSPAKLNSSQQPDSAPPASLQSKTHPSRAAFGSSGSQRKQGPQSPMQTPSKQNSHSDSHKASLGWQRPSAGWQKLHPEQQDTTPPLFWVQSATHVSVSVSHRMHGPQSGSDTHSQVAESRQAPPQQMSSAFGHSPCGSSDPLSTSAQLNTLNSGSISIVRQTRHTPQTLLGSVPSATSSHSNCSLQIRHVPQSLFFRQSGGSHVPFTQRRPPQQALSCRQRPSSSTQRPHVATSPNGWMQP
jgi:hypothetical protein